MSSTFAHLVASAPACPPRVRAAVGALSIDAPPLECLQFIAQHALDLRASIFSNDQCAPASQLARALTSTAAALPTPQSRVDVLDALPLWSSTSSAAAQSLSPLAAFLLETGAQHLSSAASIIHAASALRLDDDAKGTDFHAQSHAQCTRWDVFAVLLEGCAAANIPDAESPADAAAAMRSLILVALGRLAPRAHWSPAWIGGQRDDNEHENDDESPAWSNEQRCAHRRTVMRHFAARAERVWHALALTLSLILLRLRSKHVPHTALSNDIEWPTGVAELVAPLIVLVAAYASPLHGASAAHFAVAAHDLDARGGSNSATVDVDAWRSPASRSLAAAVAQRLAAFGLVQSPHWPLQPAPSTAAIGFSMPRFALAASPLVPAVAAAGEPFVSIFSRLAPLAILLRWPSVLGPTTRLLRTMLLHGLVRADLAATSSSNDFILREDAPWKRHPYLRRALGAIIDSLETLRSDALSLSPSPQSDALVQLQLRAALHALPTAPPIAASALPDLMPSLLLLLDDEQSCSHQTLAMRAFARLLVESGGTADVHTSEWYRPLLVRSLQRVITTGVRRREVEDADYFRGADPMADDEDNVSAALNNSALLEARDQERASKFALLDALRSSVLTVAFCVCRPPLLDEVQPPLKTKPLSVAALHRSSPSGDEFVALFSCALRELEYACLSVGDAALVVIQVLGDLVCRLLDGLGSARIAQHVPALLQIAASLLSVEESPVRATSASSVDDLVCLPLATRLVASVSRWAPSRVRAHKLALLHAYAHAYSRTVLRQEHAAPLHGATRFAATTRAVQAHLLAATTSLFHVCAAHARDRDELVAVVRELQQPPMDAELQAFVSHCASL